MCADRMFMSLQVGVEFSLGCNARAPSGTSQTRTSWTYQGTVAGVTHTLPYRQKYPHSRLQYKSCSCMSTFLSIRSGNTGAITTMWGQGQRSTSHGTSCLTIEPRAVNGLPAEMLQMRGVHKDDFCLLFAMRGALYPFASCIRGN